MMTFSCLKVLLQDSRRFFELLVDSEYRILLILFSSSWVYEYPLGFSALMISCLEKLSIPLKELR